MSSLPMIKGGGGSLEFVSYGFAYWEGSVVWTIDLNKKYFLTMTERVGGSSQQSASHDMIIDKGVITDLYSGTATPYTSTVSISGSTLSIVGNPNNTWGTDIRLYEFV